MPLPASRQMRIAFRLLGIWLLVPVVISGAVIDQRTIWRFDDVPAGRQPAGFLFVSTPKESPNHWIVQRDDKNGVLSQSGTGQSVVELAVAEGTLFGDVALSVRMRFIEGTRSAGLVWRYRDSANYYLATLDLREQVVRIYRIVGGNRTRLDEKDDLELDVSGWHQLKIEQRADDVQVWVDGVPAVDAQDRTFRDAGAIGVWTTGDSVAWFDDLTVEPAPADRNRERDRQRDRNRERNSRRN